MERKIFSWIEKYVKYFKKNVTKEINVVHHNDADGLCSGAILKLALEEKGYEVKNICIEKAHEKIFEKIHETNENFTIYADLAGFVPDIIEKKCGNSKVLVIDHHPVKKFKGKNVKVLDLELIGISGDIFISASTLCYFFAKKLGVKKELAHFAVIGSVGDYHDRSGGLLGLDRIAFENARKAGLAELEIGKFKERYFVKAHFNDFADRIAEKLGLLGFVGYYEKGYRDGIKLLESGLNRRIESKVKRLRKLRNEKYKACIEKLRKKGLNKEKFVQWFHLKNEFYPMGIKTVGNFCQIIKDMSFVDENKYLIGMQNVPKEIPDLGKIDWNLVKISGRVPHALEMKILRKEKVGFDKLFPMATKKVKGTADAIHSIAAATLIEKGKEEIFVKWLDKYAEKFKR